MPKYRLHFVAADHRTGRGHEVACPSDAAALTLAQSLRAAHPIDVWEARRKVARVDGELAHLRKS